MKIRYLNNKKMTPNHEYCSRARNVAPEKTGGKTSEKAIEKYLVRKVAEAGGIALKFTSSIADGYPDRLVLLPGGRTIWVEVKRTGEKPRRLQTVRMEELNALGQHVHWVDGINGVDMLMQQYAP